MHCTQGTPPSPRVTSDNRTEGTLARASLRALCSYLARQRSMSALHFG